MKKIFAVFALLLIPALCAACTAEPSVTARCWAYDTECTATVRGGENVAAVFEAAAKQGETLLNADGTKQYYAPAAGETVTLSDAMARIVRTALRLTEYTGGKFDLTVAPLAALWDVNHRTEPPAEDEIAQAMEKVGGTKIQLNGNQLTFAEAGVGIDIGSVGKGYGADETCRRLKEAGAQAGVISFGGNVTVFGTKEDGSAFRIGIRDPRDGADGYAGILTLTDTSAVTSGAYERFFMSGGVKYHHLLDATTGYPCQSDLISVTVVCEDGAQADLLSTALWLAGEEQARRILDEIKDDPLFAPAEAVLICTDGRMIVTGGLRDVFTPAADGFVLED